MTTEQNLIKSLGLKTTAIAKILNVSDQTVRSWACGAVKIPPAREKQLLDLSKRMAYITTK